MVQPDLFPPEPVRYCGWMREPGKPWRQACEAAGYELCWHYLLNEKGLSRFCEKTVLEEGRHP